MVTMISVEELQTLSYNPRTITNAQLDKLVVSISKDPDFMQDRPILANRTNEGIFIYAGEQRFKACKILGWEEVPVIIGDNLPDTLVRTRMMLDNQHNGTWDDVKLADFDEYLLEQLNLTEYVFKDTLASEIPEYVETPADRVYSYKVEFESKEQMEEFYMLMEQVEEVVGVSVETILSRHDEN